MAARRHSGRPHKNKVAAVAGSFEKLTSDMGLTNTIRSGIATLWWSERTAYGWVDP